MAITALIPALSANYSAAGTATASSEFSASYPAYKAFDQAYGPWIAGTTIYPQWLQYESGTGITATHYYLGGHSTQDYNPRSLNLKGSNDGTSFNTIDTRSNVYNTQNQLFTIAAGSRASYKFHRLEVTDGGATLLAVISLQLYSSPEPDYPDTANVRDTDTVNGTTGSLSSNKILKSNTGGSGAGNYNDDNLNDGNVKLGIAYGLSGTGSYTAAGVSVDDIFNGTVGDGTLTLAQSMRILLAGMAGKTSGQPGTPAFTSINGTSTVIQATVDTNGNRTAVTVTP